MNAIIHLFQTPQVILDSLEERLDKIYTPLGVDAWKKEILPNISALKNLLPLSACGGLNFRGLHHFGMHFPYDQSKERERRLKILASEDQMMIPVSICSNIRYGKKVQVNTFVRLTKLDPNPVWVEFGIDECEYPYSHADFVIPEDEQGLFDAWFNQYLLEGNTSRTDRDSLSARASFFKCENLESPLPQYMITSRDGLVSWHFRTSDRDISPIGWHRIIGDC